MAFRAVIHWRTTHASIDIQVGNNTHESIDIRVGKPNIQGAEYAPLP
jgi:hypothetical protein